VLGQGRLQAVAVEWSLFTSLLLLMLLLLLLKGHAWSSRR
jgi:hypothetical protein